MEIKRLLRPWAVMFAFFPLHEFIEKPPCPEPKQAECDRHLVAVDNPVIVHSAKYNKSFMCDTKTNGGVWIIIQRRIKKDTSFDRLWHSYKSGFGRVCSDYWIGNEYIHRITSKGLWELRIDMIYKNDSYFFLYTEFKVESEQTKYRMHFKHFVSGNERDMLNKHNGMPFSVSYTAQNNMSNGCGTKYRGGWWYGSCHTSNLNGKFDDKRYGQGVIWESLTTATDSLDSVEMKIRPQI